MTQPIDISTHSTSAHHARRKSSTSSSDGYSPPEPQTPIQSAISAASTSAKSPVLSYILSQSPSAKTAFGFPASAPRTTSSSATGTAGFGPVVEGEEYEETPASLHARRASFNAGMKQRYGGSGAAAGSFNASSPPPSASTAAQDAQMASPPQGGAGAGILRRLSIGSATWIRPNQTSPTAPPNTAVSPSSSPYTSNPAVGPGGKPIIKKKQDAAPAGGGPGLAVPAIAPAIRRAPSPMGERMLKGHFDAFH